MQRFVYLTENISHQHWNSQNYRKNAPIFSSIFLDVRSINIIFLFKLKLFLIFIMDQLNQILWTDKIGPHGKLMTSLQRKWRCFNEQIIAFSPTINLFNVRDFQRRQNNISLKTQEFIAFSSPLCKIFTNFLVFYLTNSS